MLYEFRVNMSMVLLPARIRAMQFHLSTLLWFFAVIACALGTFGAWGLLVTPFLLVQMLLVQTRTSRVSILVFWGLAGVIFNLGVHNHREASRNSFCRNNLKQIAVALNKYYYVNDSFPPAYVADAKGRPMHSWRALLLLHLDGCENLAKKYRFDEPWDGPHNRMLSRQIPNIFRCPETVAAVAGSPETTHYVAVIGPGTAWPGKEGTQIGDIRDGTANTILVVEIAGSDINWMEPRDITLKEALGGKNGICSIPSSHHSTGRCYHWNRSYPLAGNVLFADGSVSTVWDRPARETMAAMLSINGGESVDHETVFVSDSFHGWVDWGRCIGYLLFFLSLIILVSRSPASQAVPDSNPKIPNP